MEVRRRFSSETWHVFRLEMVQMGRSMVTANGKQAEGIITTGQI